MNEEVVATYHEALTVRNVEDDLRAAGIPSEKILPERGKRRIRVIVSEATKPEILEILKRHEPVELS